MTEPEPKLTAVPEHQRGWPLAARARAGRHAAEYLAGTQSEQREAVETLEGPVLGAGRRGATGKTRVLTCRIHILARAARGPGELLSVTFTNQAPPARMKLRLGADCLGQAVEGNAMARTSIHRRAHPAHPCRAGAVEIPISPCWMWTTRSACSSVCCRADNIDGQALAGADAGRPHRRWKNRGLTPSQVPAGRAAVLGGNGKGGKLSRLARRHLRGRQARDSSSRR